MKLSEAKYFMVFDVESIGLHGEGFAVGICVVDRKGSCHGIASFACPSDRAGGDPEDREWVENHIPESVWSSEMFENPESVRRAFWEIWLVWKDRGTLLFAECAWPVEAEFLMQCVFDRGPLRDTGGPYPLHEIASIRLAAGFDPLADDERKDGEGPEHDPTCDARQSARLLIEALNIIEARR